MAQYRSPFLNNFENIKRYCKPQKKKKKLKGKHILSSSHMKLLSFIIIPFYYSDCHNNTVFRSCQDIKEHDPTFFFTLKKYFCVH